MQNKKKVTDENINQRKLDHIKICLEEDIESNVSAGFNEYRFIHNALPEINLKEIILSTRLLKKKIDYPIMIAPISGGNSLAKRININLAKAAAELNIPMGVGSQRIMIEKPESIESFKIRKFAPDILLFANLGAVQLNNGFNTKECSKIVEDIDADALVLHLNPLQEAIQINGNTNYLGLLNKIINLKENLNVPIIIKEVGSGISYDVAKKLKNSGISIIDIAGLGGTSWAGVESYRNKIGKSFINWGISTAESIRLVSHIDEIKIIASGGIRSGIDVAKAIALGADLASIAKPLLKPALENSNSVIKTIKEYVDELRIAMFCIGTKNIKELKNNQHLVKVD